MTDKLKGAEEIIKQKLSDCTDLEKQNGIANRVIYLTLLCYTFCFNSSNFG